MSLAERNKIAPQMEDYDQVGDNWVPYLMRFDRPNRSYPAVTTGKWGLRQTVGKDGQLLPTDPSAVDNVGVVLGASAVFGVGATSDGKTLPSALNQCSDTTWYNFGGRAINSTQELILLNLFLPKTVKKIVVFSGVNNLTLSLISQTSSPVYNAFFAQSQFEQSMNRPTGTGIGLRRALTQLVEEVRLKLGQTPPAALQHKPDPQKAYANAIVCFERDLRALKALSDGLGAELNFALQPLATWIDKTLSVEERRIFDILDGLSPEWKTLSAGLSSLKHRYADDVQTICNGLKVPFVNLNVQPELAGPEWYFVDRVHLTDAGNAVCAQLIKKAFHL